MSPLLQTALWFAFSQAIVVAVTSTVLYLWLGPRLREILRAIKAVDKLVESAWKIQDQRTRENHLQVMRQFKGESYTGQFGGIDIHVDDQLLPGTVAVVKPKPNDV